MSDAKPRARHKPRARPPPQAAPAQQARLKLVIRRLPPTLPEDVFKKSIQAWEKSYDWLQYVPGKPASSKIKGDRHGRAYLSFTKTADLQDFWKNYNGHIFLSSSDVEYKAQVEFAPYQKVPKAPPAKQKDALSGTLEQDPDYLAFVEGLNAPVEPFKPEPVQTNKITPLIEHLRVQRAKNDAKAKAKKAKTAATKAKAQEEKKTAAQELADATTAKVAAAKEKTESAAASSAPFTKVVSTQSAKKGKGKAKAEPKADPSSNVQTRSTTEKKQAPVNKARVPPKPSHVAPQGDANKGSKGPVKKSKKPERPGQTNKKSYPVVDISGPTPAEMAAANKAKT